MERWFIVPLLISAGLVQCGRLANMRPLRGELGSDLVDEMHRGGSSDIRRLGAWRRAKPGDSVASASVGTNVLEVLGGIGNCISRSFSRYRIGQALYWFPLG